MSPDVAKIAVRSRRQAMDWSLVLVSQGIESTVVEEPAGNGWELLVNPRDYSTALQALRQFHAENRGWPWQQALPWPETHFDWGSLAWAALVMACHWLGSVRPGFLDAGTMDSSAVIAGQWWRVFTAMMLHADMGHLAENLSIGLLLVGLAMGRYGTGVGLLAAYLAGAGGNLVSLAVNHKPFHGLGASGMVMGALGLLAAQSLAARKAARVPFRNLLAGMMAGVMLFVLFGLTPGTDIAAHFGGFASGLFLGGLLAFVPHQRLQGFALNLGVGCFLVAFVVLTWWLALRPY